MRQERGFTLVEIIIAIVVLTVGLLGLMVTSALVTRMIGRGQRSAVAATNVAQRLEQLRVSGCTSQAAGTEVLYRGAMPIDSLSWRFVAAGANHWRVIVHSKHPTQQGRWRADSVETEISCLM
jgi:prepilin-type N-terminal cleavage/methylation domain-containing protein